MSLKKYQDQRKEKRDLTCVESTDPAYSCQRCKHYSKFWCARHKFAVKTTLLCEQFATYPTPAELLHKAKQTANPRETYLAALLTVEWRA